MALVLVKAAALAMALAMALAGHGLAMAMASHIFPLYGFYIQFGLLIILYRVLMVSCQILTVL